MLRTTIENVGEEEEERRIVKFRYPLPFKKNTKKKLEKNYM